MLARMSLLLLAALSSLGAQTPSRTNSASAPPAPEIPTASLCALLRKPADYHGKEVRVRARYCAGRNVVAADSDAVCADKNAICTSEKLFCAG